LPSVYHEIAQEIAYYYMLAKHCNLLMRLALLFNFIGGLSVMIAGVLVLALDINQMISGCILTVGAGVYVHIAAIKCFPRAIQSHTCVKDKMVSLLAFTIGAVPIGLVLFNHFHCGHDH
jgi:hypothetical protein